MRSSPKKYFSGENHNRLTLVSLHTKKVGGNLWLVKCGCGNEIICAANDVRSGHTKSCGCYKTETLKILRTTHGMESSREYRSWLHMRGRCKNPKDKKYPRYGGRGIKICKEWGDFSVFYNDMGTCPGGFSIDRINNDGNYEPSNCRWADAKTQSHNSTTVKLVFVFGKMLPLSEAARQLGIYHTSIQQHARDFGKTYQDSAQYFYRKKLLKDFRENFKVMVAAS